MSLWLVDVEAGTAANFVEIPGGTIKGACLIEDFLMVLKDSRVFLYVKYTHGNPSLFMRLDTLLGIYEESKEWHLVDEAHHTALGLVLPQAFLADDGLYSDGNKAMFVVRSTIVMANTPKYAIYFFGFENGKFNKPSRGKL